MTKTLPLAQDLALPLEAVTEVLAWLGRRGQGKSYGAQRLAELFHAAGAQFVVLDPVGNWSGLRLAADGKAPGIPIPVFGGLQGDVPLEPTAGRLVADLVVDRGISVVLDVSQFDSDAARARFVRDFGERFFQRRKQAPAAVHLFIEEAQEFIPQNPMGDEKGTLHVLQRIAKLGRNYGIGVSLLSQRPQEVHKKVLNLAELLFAFQLSGTHERKAVGEWIKDKSIEEDIDQELPRLARGRPHAWSPAWLKVSKVVTITPKWTFDASSTPRVGHAAGPARALSPIDLAQLRTDMAGTIERAKAEDPKELHRQIAERDREISKLSKLRNSDISHIPALPVQRVEVPVLTGKQLQAFERGTARLGKVGAQLVEVGGQVVTVARELVEAAKRAAGGNGISGHLLAHKPATAGSVRGSPPPRAVSPPQMRRQNPTSAEGLGRSAQRILNGLAWLESIGLERADKTQVALLADQSPTSGGYFNNLGKLRTAGLIDYPAPSVVQLTDAGRAAAEPVDVPTSSEDLHRQLFARLPGAQARILEHLIAEYPAAVGKDALAAATAQSPTSGGYFNNLGRLRSLGLIGYPAPGQAVALPVLFLERA